MAERYPYSILHVEDEPPFAEMASQWLNRVSDKLEIETENDPKEAVDRIESEGFDAVLTDYDMPSVDGLELTEEVMDVKPDLPVILYTGKGSEEIASEAIGKGVTDYFQKGNGEDHFDRLANRLENAACNYRMRRRLSRLEDFGEAVLEAEDPIVVRDSEGSVLAVNRGLEERTEHSSEEIVGKEAEEFDYMSWVEDPPEGRALHEQRVGVEFSEGEVYIGDTIHYSIAGREDEEEKYLVSVFKVTE